jgi:hypothetical protein
MVKFTNFSKLSILFTITLNDVNLQERRGGGENEMIRRSIACNLLDLNILL